MHHCQAKSPNPKSQVLSLLDICKKNSVCLHVFSILGSGGLNELGRKSMKTSRKWLTVAIFRKWQDNSVALWIEIAVGDD